MASTQALKTQDAKLESLGLAKTTVNDVVSYNRALDSVSEKNPIIVLIHGYPQSAYMWRHLIPLLPQDSPIYVPDLPGYGGSTPIPNPDKLRVGTTVLSALKAQTNASSTAPLPIILIGHDRGARVAHRLTVTGDPNFLIKGLCLIDIVPTSTQWNHATSAVDAAQQITGYFHWPFLAHVDLSTRMIAAYGGPKWCTEMINAWAGHNEAGLASLKADDSLSVYGGYFSDPAIVRASCEDYYHGATTDLVAQEEDQKAGKKIGVPLLLLYSAELIGKRYDFGTIWNDWVDEGVKIAHHGLKDGIGHFGAEEAPEECAIKIKEWFHEHGW